MTSVLTKESVRHIPILIFPITQEQIESWQAVCPIGVHNFDCLASSVRFLGIIDQQTYEHASNVLNSQERGASAEDVAHLMPDLSQFITIPLIIHGDPLQINPELSLYLRNNTGTLCIFRRDNGMIGHSVVLARDNLGQIVLLDPQQGEIVVGLEQIAHWIVQGHYNGLIHIPYSQEYIEIQGKKNTRLSGDEERIVRPSLASASASASAPLNFFDDQDFPRTAPGPFNHGTAPSKKNKGFRKGGTLRSNKKYINFERRKGIKRIKTMKKKRNNRRITRRIRRN